MADQNDPVINRVRQRLVSGEITQDQAAKVLQAYKAQTAQSQPEPATPSLTKFAPGQMQSGPEATDEAPDEGFSTLEMAKNIPSSAYRLGEGIYEAVRHPIRTAETVGGTLAGGLYKANEAAKGYLPEWMTTPSIPIPFTETGEGGQRTTFGREQEPYADLAIEGLKGRYGSPEAALGTLEQDPVGAMADLASVLVPVAPKVSAAINPVNVGINTGKYIAGKAIPKGLPGSLYEGAAKFSTTIPESGRKAMVDTALKHKIMPTSKGAAKLQGMVDDLNSKIDSLIDTAEKSGKTVPRNAVHKHLKELRRKKGGVRLEAPQDLKAIDRIIGEYDQHLARLGKDNLSPRDLQKLKVEAYKSINWDAKRMTGAPIKEDTYKAVARGAKEKLEALAPEVGAVNRSLGDLLELQPNLQRAANRIENRDVMSLGAPAKIGAGSVVGGPAGTALGAGSALLDLPKVKARLAIGLRGLSDSSNIQQFLMNNPNVSIAELAAILADRATEDDERLFR